MAAGGNPICNSVGINFRSDSTFMISNCGMFCLIHGLQAMRLNYRKHFYNFSWIYFKRLVGFSKKENLFIFYLYKLL